MKCEICGVETNSSGPLMDLHTGKVSRSAAVGLEVSTNGPCEKEEFRAIFGFWDHRSQKSFQICGACIADGLRDIFLKYPIRPMASIGSILSASCDAFAAPDVPPDPLVVVPKK